MLQVMLPPCRTAHKLGDSQWPVARGLMPTVTLPPFRKRAMTHTLHAYLFDVLRWPQEL
jgi:hypothetical protein